MQSENMAHQAAIIDRSEKVRKVTKATKARKRKKSANAKLQQISRVAADLFFEKGFWQTTTKEIAEACHISVGTLYYYIKSKYDFPMMFSKVHIKDINKWEKEVRKEMPDTAPEEMLRKAVRKLIYLVDLRDRMVLFWYNTAQHLEWEQLEDIVNTELRIVALFKEIIDKGCREGQFKTSDSLMTAVDIELICHTWVIKGWHLYHFYTLEQYADMCEHRSALLARGSSDLKIPEAAGYPIIEVQHLKDDWDQRRKENPNGHGSDSWVRSPTKIDYRST
ncbi:MAG: TetR/AcrR family transcriptional regulator [Dehalococcoidia bacterium]|nr:TetR/AcrR family transcriptional regulator [Dehalococcoidia bacterium]